MRTDVAVAIAVGILFGMIFLMVPGGGEVQDVTPKAGACEYERCFEDCMQDGAEECPGDRVPWRQAFCCRNYCGRECPA